MRIVDPILMELEQEAQTTKRVLERVPEEKLAWRPHPTSWSLGQLALHLANIPGGVANLSQPDTMELPPFEQAEAKSKAEILDTFAKGLAGAKEMLKGMDDSRATALWTCTKGGKPIMTVPRVGLYRTVMLNHQYHHRGQLAVYLRMLSVPVPSIYGPSADENPFA